MKKYAEYLEAIGEYGVAKAVHHPIVTVAGLPHGKISEMILFESGHTGHIYSVNKDTVDVLVFSKTPVRIGTNVVRTNEFISVPVGEALLGTIINPQGELIYSEKIFKMPVERREIERDIDGINMRIKINKPLLTGVTVTDMMVPLGRGQRELILGDKKSGKTSFILSTILNQVREGCIIIYAAIGKKKTEIKWLQEFFTKYGLTESATIVATSSDDSPSLIYLTPYTAMTLAEYYRDLGQEVLVVMDDLTTHAKFYREIALIAKNFPGRDSYPGDIFFTHARLLERAGNYKHDKVGEVSITCLPIVEIVEGNFTDYIATNIMSMTDGHLYFDSNIFRNGRRPAVNIALSVTRVGRQTQTSLKKEFNRELSAFLNNYEKMLELARFGAELSQQVKSILRKGETIYNFFNQHYQVIIPEEIQIVFLALIWLSVFDEYKEDEIHQSVENLIKLHSDERIKNVFKDMTNLKSLKDLLLHVLKRKEELVALCKIKIA